MHRIQYTLASAGSWTDAMCRHVITCVALFIYKIPLYIYYIYITFTSAESQREAVVSRYTAHIFASAGPQVDAMAW